MPSLTSVERAAHLYETQATLRDWTLPTSPVWRFPHDVDQARRSLVMAGLNEINAEVVQSSDPGVFDAPSPWHAALYCQMLQDQLALRGARLLLRGHRCSTWDLTPSILRQGVDPTRELRRVDMLEQLLSDISFNTMLTLDATGQHLYLRMSPQAYPAAAQHYGIKTPLLDFTTDPDVATWFATSDGYSDDGFACIRMIMMEPEPHAPTVLLPPPFIERIYRQRGIFLLADSLESSSSFTLRFPWRAGSSPPSLGPFRVLRHGGAPVDLLPGAVGLDKAVRLADRIVDGVETAGTPAQIAELARTLKPSLDEFIVDPLHAWTRFVDAFEDTLYALAYDFDANDRLTLDDDRLAAIVRGNVETCCSVAALYRQLPHLLPDYRKMVPPQKLAYQAAMADRIDGHALSMHYVHADEALQYGKQVGVFRSDGERG